MIVFTGLINCSRKEPGRYYNKKKGFSIKFPGDWEKKENYLGAVVFALSPLENQEDQFRENVNIIVEDIHDDTKPKDYYQTSLSELKKSVSDFVMHENGYTSINRINMKRGIFSYRLEGFRIKTLQYAYIQERRGYIISFTSIPDNFPEYRSQFEKIAQSFRLE